MSILFVILKGVEFVDHSIFQDSICSKFWDYVNSPTRSGVLQSLSFILRNNKNSNVFESLSDQNRDDLRIFLTTCESMKSIDG